MEGQFCLGMASNFWVYYVLLNLHQQPEEKKESGILDRLNIHDMIIYDIIDFLRLAYSGMIIDRIAYDSQQWQLTIRIQILRDTTVKLELHGVPTERGVLWKTRFF